MLNNKFILDACCSTRAMWFNKNHPNAVYIDIRKETTLEGDEKVIINPDFIMDFRKMEFADCSFKLVVWDPPHLKHLGETSIFKKKYGCLNKETWQADIKLGFTECWQVLQNYGILIFKWNDHDIKFQKVLNLFPVKPLFGNIASSTGRSMTQWYCFMKMPEAMS